MVVVNQGSVNDNKIFLCTTDNTGSVGSTSITYTVITPSNVGTVTSIATGTGIDGGTITSTGTIAIDSTVATLAGTQTLTNKTLTAPKIGTSILDTNGNELALLTATCSAVNEFTIANAATGAAPKLSSTGESNVDLDLEAKGTGHVTIRGNTNPGTIQFNCESNSHGQQLKAQPHSVASSAVSTLPNITGELIPGKIGGTDFTNSLLVGHATTGTLNTAENNVGIGIGTLDDTTIADNNTAVGYNAGTTITSGYRNTLLGAEAGEAILNGIYNVVVGSKAGELVNSGNYNTLLGGQAGANITSGSGNVIIGKTNAGSATGSRQLLITGNDGATSTTWIDGDSDGTVSANGGQLTTTGKALVMGF